MGYFDCRLLDLKKVACVLRLASHYAFTELTHALALQNTKKKTIVHLDMYKFSFFAHFSLATAFS